MEQIVNLDEAMSLIYGYGLNCTSHLKDKILQAILDEDDAEALRLDAVLQSVEKILGLSALEDLATRLI